MSKIWTPAERIKTAFHLGKPDEIPTFELEFQLSEEFYGSSLHDDRLNLENRSKYSSAELERFAIELADKFARVFGDKSANDMDAWVRSGDPEKDARPGLDYGIVAMHTGYNGGWNDPTDPITRLLWKRVRENFEGKRLLGCHADGTFQITEGEDICEFAYRTVDDPEGLLEEAQQKATAAIEHNKRQREAGMDVALLCHDYCFNQGPFVSPAMFDELITPYLAQICKAAREDGMLVVKHTDGNIMPILNSLVQAGPHALHSLDPMAGVDIREVKRLVGDKVALCGNVHCAALQTGTDQQVRESAEYCLKYGGEGGGYVFATSNVPFKGMPPERYQMILDIWKQHRKY